MLFLENILSSNSLVDIATTLILANNCRMAQNFGKGKLGEFVKLNAICQYFTQPNSRFTKVANVI